MPVLNGRERLLLWSVAETLAPGVRTLDDSGKAFFFEITDRALAGRPAGLRLQFRLFLAALRFLPVLRWGRPFDSLSSARRGAVLASLSAAPFAPLRLGLWGLKTIVFMGYYGQAELGPRFGYAPRRDGNEALRGR